MAWYDTGTVSVTNGSTAVTGSGTNFVAGAQVGEGFLGPDGRLYEIQAIVSATSLTLADAYLGSTQTGQAYKIVPTQSLTADLASRVSELITDYQSVVDNAGAGKFLDGSVSSPAITFVQDQDTGLYRIGGNSFGVAVAGVNKATFNSTGVDVVGTVTSDGLTVDGAWPTLTLNDTRNINTWADGDVVGELKFTTDDTGMTDPIASIRAVHNRAGTGHTSNDAGLEFYTSATTTGAIAKRMEIESTTGDISFYEDTGTTPKLFWDASAERLGIGTTSVGAPLEVLAAGTLSEDIAFFSNSSGSQKAVFRLDAGGDGELVLRDAGNNEDVVITSGGDTYFNGGNVGIGTSSPAYKLDLGTVSNGTTVFNVTNGTNSNLRFSVADGVSTILNTGGSGALAFSSGGSTERMRITSSGSLLIAKTASDIATVGLEADANGYTKITRQSATAGVNTVLLLNRLNTDGPIVDLRKDGTTVGSIGSNAGDIYLDSAGAQSGIQPAANALLPRYNGALDSGGNVSLGGSTYKFKDLYLSGGVYLGGTGAANLLDDYEEGSFTPVVADAVSGGNEATYLRNVGYYTKVGRQVTIIIELTNIDTTGLTGANDMYITGLPFTSDSPTGAVRWVGSMQQNYISLGAAAPYLTPTVFESDTTIRITEHGDNTSGDNVTVSQLTSGTADINITLTYFTS